MIIHPYKLIELCTKYVLRGIIYSVLKQISDFYADLFSINKKNPFYVFLNKLLKHIYFKVLFSNYKCAHII